MFPTHFSISQFIGMKRVDEEGFSLTFSNLNNLLWWIFVPLHLSYVSNNFPWRMGQTDQFGKSLQVNCLNRFMDFHCTSSKPRLFTSTKRILLVIETFRRHYSKIPQDIASSVCQTCRNSILLLNHSKKVSDTAAQISLIYDTKLV